jgi:hypothetical protein
MSQDHCPIHTPVLQDEVLEWLQPVPDGLYVDGTWGLADMPWPYSKGRSPPGDSSGLSGMRMQPEEQLNG